ncbi:MAG: cupin domain-containing protein [Anaerolineales bacterium]|nr:cupin domain-containing protein [Anaerolineales bacterium]
MNIVHYSDIDGKHFEGDSVQGITGRVLIGEDDGAPNFVMRLFEVEPGGYSPQHSHDWEHEIFIHQGEGAVFFEGKSYPVRAGSAIFVPPNKEHQIRNTGDGTLTFLCLIPAGPPEL